MARMVWVLVLCAASFLGAGPGQATEMRQITVTGHGEVATEPDMATLILGATHVDKEARKAMRDVSATVARMLERLAALGVDPKDVQTRRLTLNPIHSNRSSSIKNQAEISGFNASNQVMVRIRDLDRLGEVLDAMLTDGANEFHSLSFGVQEPDPLADAARRIAVADGINKAQLLAEAAGVALGPVQTIADHAGSPRPQMMEMAAARSGGMPVATGEVTISASIGMVFAIGE